jgi:peroxiredoxin
MGSKKNTGIYLLITGLLGFVAILSYLSMANSVKPGIKQGSRLPELRYFYANGVGVLKPDPAHNQLVVLFNQKCPVCFDQLSAFDRNFAKLRPDLKILFLTTDVEFIIKERSQKWKNLHDSERSIFGMIKPRTCLRVFGSLITPSYYLFNREGTLVWTSKGKVDIRYIKEIQPRGNLSN